MRSTMIRRLGGARHPVTGAIARVPLGNLVWHLRAVDGASLDGVGVRNSCIDAGVICPPRRVALRRRRCL